MWSVLLEDVLRATSTNGFKRGLSRFLENEFIAASHVD